MFQFAREFGRPRSALLREQLEIMLGVHAGEFDIAGIVNEIVAETTARTVDDMPAQDLWGIVSKYDRSHIAD